MPRDFHMKLTDSIIKSAKVADKDYSIADGHGLTLHIKASGSKLWRYRYRFNGTAKMLSLGAYPEVTLKQARITHTHLRELLTKGIDPSVDRQEQKLKAAIALDNSFSHVAHAWWNHWSTSVTPRHANETIRRLQAEAFPALGNLPINDITAGLIKTTLHKIEAREALDTASRVLMVCKQVFRYAFVHGLIEHNPCAEIKPADVLKPTKKKHYARIDEKELPELLRKIDAYDGQPLTKYALQLIALTFVRVGELVRAQWNEFDLINKQWRIPAERMKMRTLHIVPLSDQSITILTEIKNMACDDVLLFPSERRDGKSMHTNTPLDALTRLGYYKRMTTHGFRGIASTILHEQGYDHAHIELQLAHSERNAVSAAYNHALYLEPRTRMMQEWADYLDKVKA